MLRLTGGRYQGRALHTLSQPQIRYSHSRLRQALFNTLQLEVEDANILDLFAGCGSLGFEALSRNAVHVVFVEKRKIMKDCILRNAVSLDVEKQITLLHGAVEDVLDRVQLIAPFNLVFADPPYGEDWEKWLLAHLPWDQLLQKGGKFFLEWDRHCSMRKTLPEKTGILVKIREKVYGDSILTTYGR